MLAQLDPTRFCLTINHTDSASCGMLAVSTPSHPLQLGNYPLCTAGERLPQRPSRQQASKSFRLDGVLADQHTTEDGSQYLHLTFNQGKEPGAVIDAEFLFLTGDALDPSSTLSCLSYYGMQRSCVMHWCMACLRTAAVEPSDLNCEKHLQ